MELLQIHLLVREWISEAGTFVRQSLSRKLQVEEKTGHTDLVTNIDKAVEEKLVGHIRTHFPKHRILSEEGMGDQLQDMKGYVWVIDPIDGTLNFVHRKRDFGIMIALYIDGVGQLGYIYDVMRDELVFAIKDRGAYHHDRLMEKPIPKTIEESFIQINGKLLMNANDNLKNYIHKALGTRTIGASSIEHLSVIRGDSGVYFSQMLAPWDVAAGQVIAHELGLWYSTLTGEKINLLQPKTTALIAYPEIAKQIIDIYRKA